MMNHKSSSIQQSIGSIIALVVGCVGVAVAPVLAQNASSETQFLMAQTSSIAGSWRLVNMTESSAPTPMVPSADTELTADFTTDRVSGSGGCNRFMGGYQTQGDQLSIDPLASTRMACEEPILNQEMKYLMALEGAQRYEVTDQGLQIYYQTEQESGVLRFVSQTVRGLW